LLTIIAQTSTPGFSAVHPDDVRIAKVEINFLLRGAKPRANLQLANLRLAIESYFSFKERKNNDFLVGRYWVPTYLVQVVIRRKNSSTKHLELF
jgi:hypothetical protein